MGIFPDGKLHVRTIGLKDHPVDGQGPGQPLIFLDAAVIMGLQEGQVRVFVKGILFQVQARRVDVGRDDAQPLRQGPPAPD
jgi:hypothetical protein